jgi:PEP-CTERM motif
MKIFKRAVLIVLMLVLGERGGAQGFVNLDFESANLSPVPAGQFGGYVPISDALPGWAAYFGTTQLTQVLQNNLTLGSGSVDVLGPDWTFGGSAIIDGQYSVELQPDTSDALSATITQTGMIPITAKSLQFKKAPTTDPLSVTIGGQTISMTPLQNTSTYTLYGGDISAFAGLMEELKISALPGTFGFTLDDIQFSPSVVPEPSVFGLLALGGLFFGSCRRIRRISPQG